MRQPRKKSIAFKPAPPRSSDPPTPNSSPEKVEKMLDSDRKTNKKVSKQEKKGFTETSFQTTPSTPKSKQVADGGTESQKASEMVLEPEKVTTRKVWSSEDEALLLHAVNDFRKETGKNPETNHDGFYDYVIVKLSKGRLTKSRVIDKVMKMKKKFRNNNLTNQDCEIYKLSREIWGNVDANAEVDGKAGAGTSSRRREKVEDDAEERIRKRGKQRLYPELIKAFEGERMPMVGLHDGLKRGLSLVDANRLADWNNRYKELHLAEIDAYLAKLALIHELTTWYYN